MVKNILPSTGTKMTQTCYTCIYYYYYPPEYIKARLSNSTYKASCKVRGYQHTEMAANNPSDYPQLGSACEFYKPKNKR